MVVGMLLARCDGSVEDQSVAVAQTLESIHVFKDQCSDIMASLHNTSSQDIGDLNNSINNLY